MVVMTTVVLLGVMALVAAIVAGVTWHRGADERQSVQHHQHTLETLRTVADRRQQSVWPIPGRRGAATKGGPAPRPPPESGRDSRPKGDRVSPRSDNGAARSKGSAPARQGAVLARWPREPTTSPASTRESAKVPGAVRETVVFDDEAVSGPSRTAPVSASASRRTAGRLPGAAEQARRDGRARVRRARIVAGTTVVLVGAVVGSVLVLGGSHSPSHTTSPPSHPVITSGGVPTATVPSNEITPTAATAYSATYGAPSSSYTVAIGASAPCWVMATAGTTGKVVWTGTIAAGGSHSISASGTMVVRLGAPSDAAVTMNGRKVQLPTSFRSPLDLTFQAA